MFKSNLYSKNLSIILIFHIHIEYFIFKITFIRKLCKIYINFKKLISFLWHSPSKLCKYSYDYSVIYKFFRVYLVSNRWKSSW